MSEDLERSQDRLDNIQAIDPILGALRTISMGSWQLALKRRSNVQNYRMHFADIYEAILPLLKNHFGPVHEKKSSVQKIATIVVGSERGLIGKFNRDIVDHSAKYLEELQRNGMQSDMYLLGSRISRFFNQQNITYRSLTPLSTTSLPSFEVAAKMTHTLLIQYEANQIDAADMIYTSYQGPSNYKIEIDRIIPYQPKRLRRIQQHMRTWPPAIVETDPIRLYTQLVKQETAIHFYELLLDSAAAEHSARFQLLEEATQNAQRLIEELNLAVQMTRRQTITREMQELAVGSGMLNKP